jgi:hypothetical protein
LRFPISDAHPGFHLGWALIDQLGRHDEPDLPLLGASPAPPQRPSGA